MAEQIEPCPFCGIVCRVKVITQRHPLNGQLWLVACDVWCGYSSRRYPSEDKAIAAHNEVSRNNAAAKDLLDYAIAIEGWEAKLILDKNAWAGELPVFTQELYDSWMELQAMRNAAIAKATPKKDADWELGGQLSV